MKDAVRRLIDIGYERNEVNLIRGKFRVRGDTLEVMPSYEETVVRFSYFGDTVERILRMNPITGEVIEEMSEVFIFPATHYVTERQRMVKATAQIEEELALRLAELESQGKMLEAQRLRMRTAYDLEMMREVGFCTGIENYSRFLDGREPGEAPYTLLDYFPNELPHDHRRIARNGPSDRRPVRRRPQPEDDARRAWVPSALGDGQPAPAIRRVAGKGQPDRVPLGHPLRLRAFQVDPSRRANRPANRPGGSRSGGTAHPRPDRRPPA